MIHFAQYFPIFTWLNNDAEIFYKTREYHGFTFQTIFIELRLALHEMLIRKIL